MDGRWTQMDELLGSLVVEDEALVAARTSQDVTRPGIEVSPLTGSLLHLLASVTGTRRVLEFGTLAGYSTIWLARAVGPQGRVVSLELDPDNAKVARHHLTRAGVSAWVDVWCGAAATTTARMIEHGVEPFDMVFIDADKENLPLYVERAVELTRVGALIVIDNVVRDGRVLHPEGDTSAQGVRDALEAIAANPRVSATAWQTVGAKGWDGLALLRKLS